MNRIFGLLKLDGHAPTANLFEQCTYVSPWWKPDHEQILIQQSIGLSIKQRFVTPQCSHGLMPYQHASGCSLIADVYLTERQSLIEKLGVNPLFSDAELILEAYLKWGSSCTHHFKGQFAFALWDDRQQQLFLARDPFGKRVIFYSFKAYHYLIFANEFSPFRQLLPQLTLNDDLFLRYAFDNYPSEETSYKEVNKLAAAQHLIFKVGSSKPKITRYWTLGKKIFSTQPHKTREDYYEDFRHQFKQATLDCLRSHLPITAQLSGGLDSTSVAAQAALLLQEKGQLLHTFTHIPQGSSRSLYHNREYNEMHRVEAMQHHFQNIRAVFSEVSADKNIFEEIKKLHPYMDQPLRNIFNIGWYFDSLIHAHQHNSRILLTGQQGNATISWGGLSLLQYFKKWGVSTSYWLFPHQSHHGFLNYLNPDLLYSAYGKEILRQVRVYFLPHTNRLSNYPTSALDAAIATTHLWYGIDVLDPTADIALAEFCYNLPQWVFYQGRKPAQRRLLVREGLKNIVPSVIRENIYRGMQSADWYRQYNAHNKTWHQQSLNWSESTQMMLKKMYDMPFLRQLFLKYDYVDEFPNRQIITDISARLMRFLSAGFYLDDLGTTEAINRREFKLCMT